MANAIYQEALELCHKVRSNMYEPDGQIRENIRKEFELWFTENLSNLNPICREALNKVLYQFPLYDPNDHETKPDDLIKTLDEAKKLLLKESASQS